MRPLLMIFVKFPEPGKVKTRLAKALGNEEAAAVYCKLVRRVARQVLAPTVSDEAWEIWVVFDPADREAEVRAWLGPLFGAAATRYLPQVPGDLGERLAGAFAAGFGAGFENVAAIGTDCVDLDREGIAECWRLLGDGNDVVFGPADDGGYYLIGLKGPQADLFSGIPWSSEQTLTASVAAAQAGGLSYGQLATLSDVDEVEQWHALCAKDARWTR